MKSICSKRIIKTSTCNVQYSKIVLILSLLTVITTTIVACGASRYSLYTQLTPYQIAEIVLSSQPNPPAMQAVTPQTLEAPVAQSVAPQTSETPFQHANDTPYPITDENHAFRDFLTTRYRIPYSIEITDGAVLFAGGVLAAEIAVLQLYNANDAPYVRELLLEYTTRRRTVFSGYAPTQAALLADSIITIHGNYIALFVLEDPRSATAVFLSCFGDKPPTPPENNLSRSNEHTDSTTPHMPPIQTNQTAEEKALYVINLLITDEMTDFEKQLTIHDWIIDHATFDPDFFAIAPDDTPADYANPHSYTPYGVLFNRRANCFGFTSTFQLFMDLVGIECITVHGTDFMGGLHSWNLVQHGGYWYAVDITWNNPIDIPRENRPSEVIHRFFNVTSEKLFFYGHRWDRNAVPEATGRRHII